MFVIATEVKPIDGDIVLIKSNKNSVTMLKKLQLDLPDTYLHSIMRNDEVVRYDSKIHDVIGVVVLTLIYSHAASYT